MTERYGENVLSPEWEPERRRMRLMGEVCDPSTRDLLRETGFRAGIRCLEIGAGGGSVAEWMAGQGAEVVATDVDVRFLAGRPGMTVLRHDVTTEDFPAGSFDLIHARFVLEHLRERDAVLDRAVSWLAPGGTVVVESIAGFPSASSPNPAFRTAMAALCDVLARAIGTDTDWARTFPAPLQDRGLTDVGARAFLPVSGGGNASARCWSLTLAQLRPRILEHGLADEPTLDAAAALLADPAFHDLGPATLSCWATRPQDG